MKEFTINTPGDYVSLIPGDCNESVSTDTFRQYVMTSDL